MDLLFAARYPFSREAKAFITERKVEVSYDSLERAKARVLAALKEGELPQVNSRVEQVQASEIASYAISRMLVAALDSRFHAGRYAIAESKRISAQLRTEDDSVIFKVAGELGVSMKTDNPYALSFVEYLRFIPKSIDYKLINKRLGRGLVHLSRSELIRVLEEAARTRVARALPLPAKELPASVRKAAEEIRRSLPKEESLTAGFVSEENYPPCIKKLLEQLAGSENLSHTTRWYLATYLLKTGMKVEEVISAFRTAPDFNEQTTRYQVEYIARRGYSVPSCASVDSYGACVADCGIKHPLNYKKKSGAQNA